MTTLPLLTFRTRLLSASTHQRQRGYIVVSGRFPREVLGGAENGLADFAGVGSGGVLEDCFRAFESEFFPVALRLHARDSLALDFTARNALKDSAATPGRSSR